MLKVKIKKNNVFGREECKSRGVNHNDGLCENDLEETEQHGPITLSY